VKGDYVSAGTGNLIVEVKGWDGDSGLTTTDADYWVFVTGFRKIWITPLEIYRFIERFPNSHKGIEKMIGKGDSYTKDVYKIKNNDFAQYVDNLKDKKSGYVEMILDKNDPLYWFNCIIYNKDLEIYVEGAEKIKDKLGII
jgi:hypothetical protein